MTDEGMPMTCEQERSTDDAVAVLTSKLQQFKQHCSLKSQNMKYIYFFTVLGNTTGSF